MDQEQAQVARKEDVLNALGSMAGKFRREVGESLASVKDHDKPLAEATTPSLEALKAYSQAFKVASSEGGASAIPLAKRAVTTERSTRASGSVRLRLRPRRLWRKRFLETGWRKARRKRSAQAFPG